MGSEAGLERAFTKAVKSSGGQCLKLVTPGFTGIPDRMCLWPRARIVFAELKRPGRITNENDGRTARQRKVADWLRSWGFEYWLIDNMDDARRMLDSVQKEKR